MEYISFFKSQNVKVRTELVLWFTYSSFGSEQRWIETIDEKRDNQSKNLY